MKRHNNKYSGFTLVELIVTMTVAVILMSLAAPSWRSQVADNRLVAATNKLVGALAFTRSEAVKLGTQATLCSSNDQGTATPSCTGSAWQAGWLVWVDANGSGSFDSPVEIVRRAEALQGGIVVTPAPITANTTLTFGSSGFTSTPVTLKVCDGRVGNHGRQLRILVSGSASTTAGLACP